jgi:hypothetical protein
VVDVVAPGVITHRLAQAIRSAKVFRRLKPTRPRSVNRRKGLDVNFMNRADFQDLVNLHLENGKALLSRGFDLYSHDLPFLVRVAGLSLDWADELDADSGLKENRGW